MIESLYLLFHFFIIYFSKLIAKSTTEFLRVEIYVGLLQQQLLCKQQPMPINFWSIAS